MCTTLKSLLVVVFVVFGLTTEVNGQPGPASPEHDGGWFVLGFGSGIDGVSYGTSINIGRTHFWQIAANYHGDLLGSSDYIQTVSGSRGYSIIDRVGRVAVSAGPGFVWGKKDGANAMFYSGSILANLQFVLTPIKELGISLDLIGIVGPVTSSAGLRVAFVFEGNK